MVKYRFEFSKTGETKFVSHLDLVRLFTRVFKRAGLPLAYSEGFNPHPKMSIGIPLSVGVTSECELLDAEFYHEVDEQEIKERLNATMPMGITMTKVRRLAEGAKKLSSVAQAEYAVELGAEISQEQIAAFLEQPVIEIEKKTKRSEKLTDIRPDIFGIEWLSEGKVLMTLATGSSANLKPEVVVRAMERSLSGFSAGVLTIHRKSMSDESGSALI